MKTLLSPKELSKAIGVSESSLKRWADDGRIQVSRTAGGHRRIPVPEAIRFIRENRTPLLHPEILGLSAAVTSASDLGRHVDIHERFYLCLREGQDAQARGLLTSQYLNGKTIAEICDGPVREAMHRIGELWQHNETGIYFEHRATDICIQALTEIRSMIQVPEDTIPMVGGAPAGDPYILPSLSVATTLSGEGYQAINLGANTPLETLRLAAEHQQAKLVWLSITVKPKSKDFTDELLDLSRMLQDIDARLLVGGQKMNQATIPASENLFFAHSMTELVAFTKGLMVTTKQNQ